MKNIRLTENKHSWEDVRLYFGQLPVWWIKSLLNGVSCVPAWATCQKRANFAFLLANVPTCQWKCQRSNSVPIFQFGEPTCQKAYQFFNFACQKMYQFCNYFSKEFFNFEFFN